MCVFVPDNMILYIVYAIICSKLHCSHQLISIHLTSAPDASQTGGIVMLSLETTRRGGRRCDGPMGWWNARHRRKAQGVERGAEEEGAVR